MTVKFTITVEGAQKTPFISGAKQRSLRSFLNYLVALMSGSYSPAGASMTVRNAGVAATDTVTFSGAVSTNDTVTINGQALTATQQHATGTITFSVAGASVDETVVVNGATFTAKTGCARGTAAFSTIVADNVVTVNGQAFTAKVSPSGENQFALGASDAEAATNLAAKISAHSVIGLIIEAVAVSDTVYIKALASGTAGNAYTLTKTGSPITVSGATLSGGAALTAAQFDKGDDYLQAARDFFTKFAASTDYRLVGVVTATRSNGVITFRAVTSGTGGNAITLAETGTNIAKSAATLTNGATAANNQFDPGNSASTAAASFVTAVLASTTRKVSGLVTPSAVAGVVTLTASLPGVAGNMFTLAKSGSNIAVGAAAFSGGTEDAPFTFAL